MLCLLMWRVVQASAVACGLLAAPAAGASAVALRGRAAPAGGAATLGRFSCQHSSIARLRTITVQAVMRHRAGTQRMQMRFELLWTAPGQSSSYTEHGGDLNQWRHPTNPPTLGQRPNDVWRVTQRVRNLAPEGSYQFRVDFRWLGQGGSPLGQVSLYSPRCREAT